mmetsp:Transcript_63254/g.139117  ORF Transcript_63254/g.139117 Transcript_63254/m.139117 type:complete len:358 (-) Transcript_63254:27-1100(-)
MLAQRRRFHLEHPDLSIVADGGEPYVPLKAWGEGPPVINEGSGHSSPTKAQSNLLGLAATSTTPSQTKPRSRDRHGRFRSTSSGCTTPSSRTGDIDYSTHTKPWSRDSAKIGSERCSLPLPGQERPSSSVGKRGSPGIGSASGDSTPTIRASRTAVGGDLSRKSSIGGNSGHSTPTIRASRKTVSGDLPRMHSISSDTLTQAWNERFLGNSGNRRSMLIESPTSVDSPSAGGNRLMESAESVDSPTAGGNRRSMLKESPSSADSPSSPVVATRPRLICASDDAFLFSASRLEAVVEKRIDEKRERRMSTVTKGPRYSRSHSTVSLGSCSEPAGSLASRHSCTSLWDPTLIAAQLQAA